jgi:hypothetical protein
MVDCEEGVGISFKQLTQAIKDCANLVGLVWVGGGYLFFLYDCRAFDLFFMCLFLAQMCFPTHWLSQYFLQLCCLTPVI